MVFSLRPVRLVAILVGSFTLLRAAAGAQTVLEGVDLVVVERIRAEGYHRSQIDQLAGYLMDVIGPRLTGSTAMRRANEWSADQFRRWGLANVVVEPWGRFGRGWERVSFSGRILEPFIWPLQGTALAWSGSTPGPVSGPAVYVRIADTADFGRYRGLLRGALVLRDTAVVSPPEFARDSLRTPLARLRDTTPEPTPPAAGPEQRARSRAQDELERRIDDLFRAEQVTAILTPSSRPYTILRPRGGPLGTLARDSAGFEPLPAVMLSQEQYNLIFRNLRRGIPVRLELDVRNRWLTDDPMAYNTLAEIPGTDLRDQVVMIGAHLDSWFGGTGATDNGAGSVVVMEAMRILKTLGLAPRRTIRVALWSAEEGGLRGSRGWVRRHREELDRISAYLNIDTGTGRIRAIWDQHNGAAGRIFRQILAPFEPDGVVGIRRGYDGGTDHLSFDEAGVPGFDFDQDLIEYWTRSHHTAADTYERLLMDDLRQAAVVMAATAYHLAMRDGMMPRKPAPAGTGN